MYEYLKVTGQEEKIRKFKTLWGQSSERTQSPLAEAAEQRHGHDLLDEHLGLVDRAIQDRIIPQYHQFSICYQ